MISTTGLLGIGQSSCAPVQEEFRIVAVQTVTSGDGMVCGGQDEGER